MTAQPRFRVVTANALTSGDVVYLTGCDEWSPELLHAEFIDDADHADFRLTVASRQTRLVVDAHLADPAFRAWRAAGLEKSYDPEPYAKDLPSGPWPA